MAPPIPPSTPTPPGSGEDRRTTHRGHFPVFWNLMFRGLRTLGLKLSSFYVTVGIFLVGGALIAIVATLGFAGLAGIIFSGRTQAYDDSILLWLKAHHTPELTRLMVEMTYLGTGTVVVVVVGVAAMFLWHTEHRHSARLLLFATCSSIPLNWTLKYIYHRARPTLFEWEANPVSSSFPSGHAMSATVVYGTVAYLVIRLQKQYWSKALTLIATIFLILLICVTRLYLGVHYPSDVVGGMIVGLAWASFCMATLEATLALARYRTPAASAVLHELPTQTPAPLTPTPPPAPSAG